MVQVTGIQCLKCWSLTPNENTYDTQEHREKYHNMNQKKISMKKFTQSTTVNVQKIPFQKKLKMFLRYVIHMGQYYGNCSSSEELVHVALFSLLATTILGLGGIVLLLLVVGWPFVEISFTLLGTVVFLLFWLAKWLAYD